MFDDDRITVLRAWPVWRAWRFTSAKGWQGARPWEPVIRWMQETTTESWLRRAMARFEESLAPAVEPAGNARRTAASERQLVGLHARRRAARTFLDRIPLDVRQVAARFPDRQWHLVALTARHPGAIELAADNPALAYALASSWIFHRPAVRDPWRAAERLVPKKRLRIAGWLGFPATQGVVGILAKVPTRALTPRRLLYLREALCTAAPPKALHHLPRLDTGVLRILCDAQLIGCAAFTLLEEISASRAHSRSHDVAYLLRDSVRMLAIVRPGERLPAQRTIRAVRHIHDTLAADLARIRDGRLLDLSLPPPPVRGTELIVPLTQPSDLVEEGRSMHHCVGSYVEEVAGGGCFVYRVLGPERATLSLRRRAGGWQIDQISGVANGPVSAGTRLVAAEWLRQALVDGTGAGA